MFRIAYISTLVLMLCLGGVAQQQAQGFYSKTATPIWDTIAGSPRPIVISSPDHLSRVTASYIEDSQGNEHVDLEVTGKVGALSANIGPGVGSELLWAADSKAFFVTTSDEGANGAYRLIVVDIFDGKLQSRELTELIHRDFGHPFRCGWPEPPNVAGISWVGLNHHVWAVAEVINHSNCDSFGTFKAYEVDPAAMKIERSLNQLEAKQQLAALLGNELQGSPDECIRNPASCFVSTNHPELAPKR